MSQNRHKVGLKTPLVSGSKENGHSPQLTTQFTTGVNPLQMPLVGRNNLPRLVPQLEGIINPAFDSGKKGVKYQAPLPPAGFTPHSPSTKGLPSGAASVCQACIQQRQCGGCNRSLTGFTSVSRASSVCQGCLKRRPSGAETVCQGCVRAESACQGCVRQRPHQGKCRCDHQRGADTSMLLPSTSDMARTPDPQRTHTPTHKVLRCRHIMS